MPVGSALKVGCIGTHKGAGDHAAYAVVALQHFPGDLAVAIQFLQRHDRFVRGNLKYAVG